MVANLLSLGARVVYLGLAALGLSIASGGYPPPASGPPVMLAVGGLLAVAGVAGAIWPDKIRSGTSGPD